MNESLNRLANLFNKESRIIIGLMSGTSLDGLDIALCKISGSGLNTKAELIHFETASYADDFKSDVKKIFSKKEADLEKVTLLNAKIAAIHADLINAFLKKHGVAKNDVDCIASHGQSIYHAPQRLHKLEGYPNATLQIGDGDHIAVKTGITTISDFRQKHVAAGGEGAPLALYADYILCTSKTENRILLNIGGISNFTFLPKDVREGRIICTDAGPGNTLIDNLCKKHFNKSYDKDGEIARRGTVNKALLKQMMSHSFFRDDLPKTTGPELFNFNFINQALADAGVSEISPDDLISTATQFTVEGISSTLRQAIGDKEFSLYASGGGANNTYLIEKLSENFPDRRILKMNALGIDGDAKEALLFALLANETLCGSRLTIDSGQSVTMGKISLPD